MANSEDLSYYMNLPYRIEVIPDEEQTSYTMVVPQLKGCMAFGETIEEAYASLVEAKRLWLETCLHRGWPIPEPESEELKEYSGRFSVRLPRYLHRELAELAKAESTSLNQLVVAFLSEGKERQRQKRLVTQTVGTKLARGEDERLISLALWRSGRISQRRKLVWEDAEKQVADRRRVGDHVFHSYAGAWPDIPVIPQTWDPDKPCD
jgi:antitoxin HicB